MPEKIKDIQPPHGLVRLAFRFPIWFYRLGLGRLLGSRFLLLSHTGRRSGLPRQTVLEVVRYDKASQTYIVAAGFGTKSDWYQNLMANPHAVVDSGGRSMPIIAKRLSPEAAGNELLEYNRRHPGLILRLARIMGYHLDGTEADIRAFGEMLPMFAFQPRGLHD